MSKRIAIVLFAAIAAPAVAADFADIRGTWKGNTESIVMGAGNVHHAPAQPSEPEFRSVPVTMTIDKQDGRRFAGTFASPRGVTKIVGVLAHGGAVYITDDIGYSHGTIVTPGRIELCYQYASAASRIASCTELTKQP